MNIFFVEDSEAVRENLRLGLADPFPVNIVGFAVNEQGAIEHFGDIEHIDTLQPDIVILYQPAIQIGPFRTEAHHEASSWDQNHVAGQLRQRVLQGSK